MGAYNILKTEIQCKHCKNVFSGSVQFKFGDTWQNVYYIGEKIKWGGADIGYPGHEKVKVYGILEEQKCPICDFPLEYEYDIIVEKDIIKNVIPLTNLEDYNSGDGNYNFL